MTQQNNPLSASQEDYLEAIYRIYLSGREVKPKDLVEALHVAGASVTNALRALAEKGLITYAPYGGFSLTPRGEAVAEDIYGRHLKLKSFLMNMLSVGESEANETACRMEHAVPTHIINKLVRFADFIESCPRAGSVWISGFERSCAHEHDPDRCRRCAEAAIRKID